MLVGASVGSLVAVGLGVEEGAGVGDVEGEGIGDVETGRAGEQAARLALSAVEASKINHADTIFFDIAFLFRELYVLYSTPLR